MSILAVVAAGLIAASPDSLLVSAEWLASHLGRPDLVVIQVGRDRAGFDAGHIPGSRFLPLSAIVTERDGLPNELPPLPALDSVMESLGIGDSGRLIVTGDPLGAARLFFTLEYLGQAGRVALLDGGLDAWKRANGALSTEPVSSEQRAFHPRPDPRLLVGADWVRAHLNDSTVALLDARPPAEFAGGPSPGVPRPGHIPGARSIFWQTLLDPTGRLLPLDELERRFRAEGALAGDTVVAYCRTGVQASFLYFVARYLGYSTRLYDGSFIEWSRLAESPVE
jgi:thiosulfate/3-mercaptopyruvate sulfurtransferase